MSQDAKAEPAAPAGEDEGCPHETLMPRWRGPDVMGDDSKAMGWVCHRCHREFPPYMVENRKVRRLAL